MRSPSSASSYCCPRALDVLATDQCTLLALFAARPSVIAAILRWRRQRLARSPASAATPPQSAGPRPPSARSLARPARRASLLCPMFRHPPLHCSFPRCGGDARCKLQAVSLYLYTRALINSDVLRAHEHFALLFLLYAYAYNFKSANRAHTCKKSCNLTCASRALTSAYNIQ